MNICRRCILPDTFPGVTFDAEGVCSHCRKFAGKEEKLQEDKKKYERKFLDLLEAIRAAARPSDYDVLMAYSGGKDSTYTMTLLRRKYGLRVLAVSFDNGFVSDAARRNIAEVTNRLGIDHLFFKPDWALLKKVFAAAAARDFYSKKTLERASTICTTCIGLVKSVCLKTALEKGIPMIGFGWSPGQAPVQSSIMKNNASLIRSTQQALAGPLREIAGDAIDGYFLAERHFALPADAFPYNVHPMAWEHYDEKMIIEEIGRLGWVEPRDTDTNSSNCTLNAFANEIHVKRLGFHPYVWEIANMVREGVMSRQEGYEKIYNDRGKEMVARAKDALGL